jgi:hypothetical protein
MGEIVRLRSAEDRRAALARVPDPLRELVAALVVEWFTKRKLKESREANLF